MGGRFAVKKKKEKKETNDQGKIFNYKIKKKTDIKNLEMFLFWSTCSSVAHSTNKLRLYKIKIGVKHTHPPLVIRQMGTTIP
jgi:hypothetical protein